MPLVDHVVETDISRSTRARQLESAFDVPASQRATLRWQGDVPIEGAPWNVGLILGPSGCGKSTLLHSMFPDDLALTWERAAIVDDFAPELGLEQIVSICQAVGFNTIPAWLRPHRVLSTGERFRADLARRMIETPAQSTIVVDEFTSVVDRQVAQIASHAVQKWVRKHDRRAVLASCHYDIIDWLQPDWLLEPATMTFTRRSLQRRPALNVEIARVDYSAWQLFAPFHYLTNRLHKAARCFVLFVNDVPAAFAGMLYRPHPTAKNVFGLSRVVTLPDYQGLGLAFVLMDHLASAYKATRRRFHTYPAHPALIRGFDKSPMWSMQKKPGQLIPFGKSSTMKPKDAARGGTRACAIFEYVGPAMSNSLDAQALIDGDRVSQAA